MPPLSAIKGANMKVKNLRIYSGDLATLQEEYTALGFDTSLDAGVLTVYTVRRKKEKKDDKKARRR
jgi:hypothetical protein